MRDCSVGCKSTTRVCGLAALVAVAALTLVLTDPARAEGGSVASEATNATAPVAESAPLMNAATSTVDEGSAAPQTAAKLVAEAAATEAAAAPVQQVTGPVTEAAVKTADEPVAAAVQQTAAPAEAAAKTAETVAVPIEQAAAPVTETVTKMVEPVTETVEQATVPVTETAEKAVDQVTADGERVAEAAGEALMPVAAAVEQTAIPVPTSFGRERRHPAAAIPGRDAAGSSRAASVVAAFAGSLAIDDSGQAPTVARGRGEASDPGAPGLLHRYGGFALAGSASGGSAAAMLLLALASIVALAAPYRLLRLARELVPEPYFLSPLERPG